MKQRYGVLLLLLAVLAFSVPTSAGTYVFTYFQNTSTSSTTTIIEASGWNATNTTTSTDLHVNITSGNLANGGLYLCGNPVNTSIGGFITVNKTYYETNCNG